MVLERVRQRVPQRALLREVPFHAGGPARVRATMEAQQA